MIGGGAVQSAEGGVDGQPRSNRNEKAKRSQEKKGQKESSRPGRRSDHRAPGVAMDWKRRAWSGLRSSEGNTLRALQSD